MVFILAPYKDHQVVVTIYSDISRAEWYMKLQN